MFTFAADFHLRPGSQEDSERFLAWLRQVLPESQAVYLLGDLFDYYFTGLEGPAAGILERLRNPRVHLLPGNRDFLLHNLRLEGLDIVPAEELRLDLFGVQALIAHGHTLTENDRGFRVLHRWGWPLLRLLDRHLSPALKTHLARRLVASSSVIRPPEAHIPADIADLRGVDMVICGHLHREIRLPGLTVIPAFVDTGAWLGWNAHGPQLYRSRV